MPSHPEFPDYYRWLGLEFGADKESIKKNFRKLAKTYHPDNPRTGSKTHFQNILKAYQTLSSEKDRSIYDYAYMAYFYKNLSIQDTNTKNTPDSLSASSNPNLFITRIPPGRVRFAHSVTEYARMGLMRKGYRMKDRKKWTGIHHDIEIAIEREEMGKILRLEIPLVVRVLCPECLGSDIYCSACGGRGSYKSSRNLAIDLLPGGWSPGQVLEIDLSRFRPDRFTYFKKKFIRILLFLGDSS